MKLLLKILGGLVAFGILAFAVVYLLFNESEPMSEPTAEADAMAEKMLEAINKEAWDTTKIVTWTFPGGHKFLWDKTRHYTQVEWGENRVLLDIGNISGKVFKNGTEVTGEEAQATLKTAWDYFNNDSFWLNAPAKVFDPGTVRSIVDIEGRKGLKVQYTSGGTTPGDSYVWFLDEQGMPTGYKMWVQIIPIGGLEFGWTDYKTLYSGAKVATKHPNEAKALELTGIDAAESFADLGIEGDPFAGM